MAHYLGSLALGKLDGIVLMRISHSHDPFVKVSCMLVMIDVPPPFHSPVRLAMAAPLISGIHLNTIRPLGHLPIRYIPRQRSGWCPPALYATSLVVERALYYTPALRDVKIRYITCQASAFNAWVLGVVDG